MKAQRGMALALAGALMAGCSSSGSVRSADGRPLPSATFSMLTVPPTSDFPSPTFPSVPTSFASLLPTDIPLPTATTENPHYTGTAKDTCPYLSANQVALLVGVDIEKAVRNDEKSAKGCSYSYTADASGLFQEYWVSLSFTAGAGSYGYTYVLKQITDAKSVSGIGSKAAFGSGTMVVLTRDNGVAIIMTVMPDYLDDPSMAEKIFKAAASKL